MILTAHQPVYLPWLGLFHKIALAERFCVFDIVQYQKRDYNNRNRIKTAAGPVWLSVPVESKNHLQTKICDVKIINNGWNRRHLRSVQVNYNKSKYYGDYIEQLEEVLIAIEYKYLTDLNFRLLTMFLEAFDIAVSIDKASDYDFAGAKSELVLDMCLKLGAGDYIFGEQGKNYADVDEFLARGVTPYFQQYRHPVYPQLHGEFLPAMSALDLLFNAGPASREIMMSGNAAGLTALERGSMSRVPERQTA